MKECIYERTGFSFSFFFLNIFYTYISNALNLAITVWLNELYTSCLIIRYNSKIREKETYIS